MVKEKNIDIQTISKKLIDLAYKSGKDSTNSFTDFLDFVISIFDCKYVKMGRMAEIMRNVSHSPIFPIFMDWLMLMTEKIESEGVYDSIGGIYESLFQTKGKASGLGQFFTPISVCTLMAKLTGKNDERIIVSDSACGSGRTLLAKWNLLDKTKFHYFVAEDIDTVSCKMCAINMMIHGMIGVVICHDAFAEPTTARISYAINEVRYPFPTPLYSIRIMNNQEFQIYKSKIKL